MRKYDKYIGHYVTVNEADETAQDANQNTEQQTAQQDTNKSVQQLSVTRRGTTITYDFEY